MGLKLAALLMTTGMGTSVAGALLVVQDVLPPSVLTDESLVPLGIAIGVIVAAVTGGIKIALWMDRTNRELANAKREIAELQAVLSEKPKEERPEGSG